MRYKRKTLNKNFDDALRESKKTLEEIEAILKSQMRPLEDELCEKYKTPNDGKDNETMGKVHENNEVELGYDSPYGAPNSHRFHAVCVDEDGKLVFLSENSKSLLSDKINNAEDLSEIVAIYEGSLLKFLERRIIQID